MIEISTGVFVNPRLVTSVCKQGDSVIIRFSGTPDLILTPTDGTSPLTLASEIARKLRGK